MPVTAFLIVAYCQTLQLQKGLRVRVFKLDRFMVAVVFFLHFHVSFAEAKNAENFELPKSKLTLNLEFSNEGVALYKDRLIYLVDTTVEECIKLFGGLPRKLNGQDYTTLKIVVSDGFGGEADPEFIDLRISDTKLFGFYNWEMLLIHELLHLWSAETFRYVDDQEQWFNEGVTEYLTFRIAAKLGIIKQEDVLNTFSKPLSTYLSAKGLGRYSMRSAASTDQLKRQHYFLIYHGGYVAGMVLDHQIRLRSHEKFSLSTLMSELYFSHSREKPYSSSSIVRLIKRTTMLDDQQVLSKMLTFD